MNEHENSDQTEQQPHKNFFSKPIFRRFSIPKLIGFGLIAIILFTIAISLIGFGFRTAFFGSRSSSYVTSQEALSGYGDALGLAPSSKSISQLFLLSPSWGFWP